MKLKIVRSGSTADWWLIERAEHENRRWIGSVRYADGLSGPALCYSGRVSDADVEGDGLEMLAIADAIERRAAFSAKRCAVHVYGDRVELWSPRNSRTPGVVTLAATRRFSFGGEPVRAGPELRRIAALERRAPEGLPLVEAETRRYRLPGSSAQLRPAQALALRELREEALFGSMRVGSGKTLVSFLAPLATGAKCPLLLVPASLVERTRARFRVLSLDWRSFPGEWQILGYEELSQTKSAELLERLSPDLIVADECHRLKNPRSAVSRRVFRYLEANAHRCAFVGLSGSPITRRLEDVSALLEASLREGSPLPRTYGELAEWGLAVDEDLPHAVGRKAPGALRLLEGRPLSGPDEARAAVGRRCVETKGFVSVPGEGPTMSLAIEEAFFEPPRAVAEALQKLREDWELPGRLVSDAAAMWSLERQLALGFYYRWKEEPPVEWLDARREWSRLVRQIIARNQRGIDSEKALKDSCDAGEERSHVVDALDRWRTADGAFEPELVTEWISKEPVERVRELALACPTPPVVWVEHRAFGSALAARARWSYHAADGLDQRGVHVEQAKGDEPIVASVKSCGTGTNLQYAFSCNVITSIRSNGGELEQLIGRTHREGQRADEVLVRVVIGCAQNRLDLDRAYESARFLERATQQPQKLLLAEKR